MMDFLGLGDPTRQPINRKMREEILRRDGYRCVYCDSRQKPFHIDHVRPVSRGGRDTMDNLVTSCSACNLAKGDRILPGWTTDSKIAAYRRERRALAAQQPRAYRRSTAPRVVRRRRKTRARKHWLRESLLFLGVAIIAVIAAVAIT